MNHTPPDFLALSSIEEEFLTSRPEAARKAITHAGEKGRSLEVEVMALLRSFLPNEYALSTGFIVYHSGKEQRLSLLNSISLSTTQFDVDRLPDCPAVMCSR